LHKGKVRRQQKQRAFSAASPNGGAMDLRRNAPAAERNRAPIEAVLREELPGAGRVLEVASGTGQHATWFAAAFPNLIWQPSDPDPGALASIAAWRAEAGLGNLLAPILLDADRDPWPVAAADAILCINMVHISPWTATLGLLRGAGALLPSGAPLILYGPYRRDGVPTAPSNESFDASLKSRNPDWGLRALETVTAEAETQCLHFDRLVEMPANNVTVIYRRT
jgi:SAM-dependent methyltransferase